MNRGKVIIRSSVIGIAVNLVLVLIKVIGGWLSNSVAMVLDAVNSFSDALGQIITIVGTKLSGKAPDKKHPYGYGRIEYLTAVITALLVMVAGVTSLRESVDKILHPQETVYTWITITIMVISVLSKLIYGVFMRRTGKSVQAASLEAMGTDAFMDAVLSFSTLIAVMVKAASGTNIEGIVGVIISVFIIKAGIEMIAETLNSLIGTRAEGELTREIKKKVASYPGVNGAYDLILHNYGPNESIASVHVEVDDQMTARELHGLTRKIAAEVYVEYGIILTVGIYASNTSDQEAAEIKDTLLAIVGQYPTIMQTHGFYVDKENKLVTADLIFEFSEKEKAQIADRVSQKLRDSYPEYRFDIILDSDYSD